MNPLYMPSEEGNMVRICLTEKNTQNKFSRSYLPIQAGRGYLLFLIPFPHRNAAHIWYPAKRNELLKRKL